MSNRVDRRALSVIAVFSLLAFCGGSLFAQSASPRIAVVDLEQLVAQSAMGQELQSKLEKLQADAMVEGEALSQAAQDTRRRISEGAGVLSEEKLAELQQQFENETIAIRRFQDDKQREGQKIQQESLRDIERALKPIFDRLRDEDGYDLILNRAPGIVILASDAIDITEVVIERFNSQVSG